MDTIRPITLLLVILTSIWTSEALQCYCGSNATKIVTCEAWPTYLCVTYKTPCSPGDKSSEECKQLNPPKKVYIFHYNYQSTCNDPFVPEYYDPQCCSTDYCNAPPGTPIASNPPKPSGGPSKKTENTNITLYIILAAALVLLTSGAIFLIVRRFRNAIQPKKVDSEESQKLLVVVEEPPKPPKILGRGSNTIVQKASMVDGRSVAEKVVLNPKLFSVDLAKERNILSQLKNRNCHIIEELGLHNSSLYLELCDCTLADRLALGQLNELEILSYCKQLAYALRFIQFDFSVEEAVIHGDINPRNILLKKEHDIDKYKDVPYILKLADFGLARMELKKEGVLPFFEIDKSGKDPDIYTAPDSVDPQTKKQICSFVTDLFSFAVVCAQILLTQKKEEQIDDLKSLYDELRFTVQKKDSFQKLIAQFCLDVIDYKDTNPRPSKYRGKQVSVPATTRPQTTDTVKSKLYQFIDMLEAQEKFYRDNNLNPSQDSEKVEH